MTDKPIKGVYLHNSSCSKKFISRVQSSFSSRGLKNPTKRNSRQLRQARETSYLFTETRRCFLFYIRGQKRKSIYASRKTSHEIAYNYVNADRLNDLDLFRFLLHFFVFFFRLRLRCTVQRLSSVAQTTLHFSFIFFFTSFFIARESHTCLCII